MNFSLKSKDCFHAVALSRKVGKVHPYNNIHHTLWDIHQNGRFYTISKTLTSDTVKIKMCITARILLSLLKNKCWVLYLNQDQSIGVGSAHPSEFKILRGKLHYTAYHTHKKIHEYESSLSWGRTVQTDPPQNHHSVCVCGGDSPLRSNLEWTSWLEIQTSRMNTITFKAYISKRWWAAYVACFLFFRWKAAFFFHF